MYDNDLVLDIFSRSKLIHHYYFLIYYHKVFSSSVHAFSVAGQVIRLSLFVLGHTRQEESGSSRFEISSINQINFQTAHTAIPTLSLLRVCYSKVFPGGRGRCSPGLNPSNLYPLFGLSIV